MSAEYIATRFIGAARRVNEVCKVFACLRAKSLRLSKAI